jgi:hypothetical protein
MLIAARNSQEFAVSAEISEKHIVPFAVYRQCNNILTAALRIGVENVIFITVCTSPDSHPALKWMANASHLHRPAQVAAILCGLREQFQPTDFLNYGRATVRNAAW